MNFRVRGLFSQPRKSKKNEDKYEKFEIECIKTGPANIINLFSLDTKRKEIS